MRHALIAFFLALLFGFESTNAQDLEVGEWEMFAAPISGPNNVPARRFPPMWFFNTRTGTVYRVVDGGEDRHFVCDDEDDPFPPVVPCVDFFGLVPVPVVAFDNEMDALVAVDRDPQPGDWRMFARESAGLPVYSEGAFLFNAYTGAVYEVAAYCHDEDIPAIGHVGTFSFVAGCMFKVPVRDTYNQPAALNPHASGLLQ